MTDEKLERWNELNWRERLEYNFPAWAAFHQFGRSQWWNGRSWSDEYEFSKSYEVCCIEYPLRPHSDDPAPKLHLQIVEEVQT